MGKVLQMTTKPGKISISDMKKAINKKLGMEVAYDLNHENPASIKDWISTGSTILDLAISNKPNGGLVAGRITEINGLEGSGKSLIGAHALASTQEKDGLAVYIDTESSVSSEFLQGAFFLFR